MSKLPIRMSTWHVKDTSTNKKIVLKEIMVAGEKKHLPLMATSEVYLLRVYRRVFGKRTIFNAVFKKKRLKVLKIELDEKIFGYGAGNLNVEGQKKK